MVNCTWNRNFQNLDSPGGDCSVGCDVRSN